MTVSGDTRSYVICTTARSGSNLVCDYLAKTGRLGRPTEFFNPDIVRTGTFGQRFSFADHVAVSDYLDWLKSAHSTPNGVFGVKMLFEDYEHLGQFPAVRALLETSTLVRLTRRRKTAQAVSYLMAVETGQWIASDVARKPIDQVEFDFSKINQHLDRLCMQDARWDAALDSRGLSALHWHFEDFLLAPHDHLNSLAASMDVDLPNTRIHTSLEKQSTERSHEFLVAFQKEAKTQGMRETGEITYEGVTFCP